MQLDLIYTAVGIVSASIAIGLIVQHLIVAKLHRAASTTKWKADDMVISALGQMPLLWCVCAGFYALLLTGNIAPNHVRIAENVLVTVILVSATLFCARLAASMAEGIAAREASRLPSTSLLTNGARIIVFIIGAIIVLQNLNIKITPIITALGLGGLAIALALEDTLNNLFCGVQIIAARIVRPGDYVKLDSGHAGYVTDVKARNTTIRSFPDNNRIIVPNSTLASSTLINYSLPEKSLWVDIVVGIAYDSDLSHVETVSLEVATKISKTVRGGLDAHAPVLRYEEFGDSSINFRLRLFVSEFEDQFLIRHELIKALHKRFSQEGIEIPFPIRTVHLKGGKA